MNKVFPLVLRFEVLRCGVNAARSPTCRVGAGLALANREDFCETFLCGSILVGPANVYLASDGDGLRGERSALQGEEREGASRDARRTWIEYVPPGVIGAGSEPSGSLFGPIIELEGRSDVQRVFVGDVRGLEMPRTRFCCAGGCLSRLGPIRSWQLMT